MGRIITNYQQLATSPLREAALDIIEVGLKTLQTKEIIHQSLSLSGHLLKVRDHYFDLSRFDRLFVIGIGKAAIAMGQAIEEILGDRLTAGFILDRKEGHFNRLTSLLGTHPDPSKRNVEATKEILDFVSGTDAKTLVLVLISGGGSAFLTSPHGISVQEKALIAHKLMDQGATISELNTVRKHLSNVKGGQLAQAAYPATVVSLILSDVPGDDLATIASGPTVLDKTTISQAKRIAEKYKISTNLPWRETPKDKKYFERVENILIATAGSAFQPMANEATRHGLKSLVLSSQLAGDADRVGRAMLKRLHTNEVILVAGETTVKVKGEGHGGRNQQLVLAALPYLKENQLILSVGTDGHDNTDHAGAIGDLVTLQKAGEKKIDPKLYALRNDSYAFFSLVGDAIVTGELESNFADLILCLSKKF